MGRLEKFIKRISKNSNQNSLQIYKQSIKTCVSYGRKIGFNDFEDAKSFNYMVFVLLMDLTMYFVVILNWVYNQKIFFKLTKFSGLVLLHLYFQGGSGKIRFLHCDACVCDSGEVLSKNYDVFDQFWTIFSPLHQRKIVKEARTFIHLLLVPTLYEKTLSFPFKKLN